MKTIFTFLFVLGCFVASGQTLNADMLPQEESEFFYHQFEAEDIPIIQKDYVSEFTGFLDVSDREFTPLNQGYPNRIDVLEDTVVWVSFLAEIFEDDSIKKHYTLDEDGFFSLVLLELYDDFPSTNTVMHNLFRFPMNVGDTVSYVSAGSQKVREYIGTCDILTPEGLFEDLVAIAQTSVDFFGESTQIIFCSQQNLLIPVCRAFLDLEEGSYWFIYALGVTDPVVGVAENNSTEVKLYPIPAQENLLVNVNTNAIARVYSIAGDAVLMQGCMRGQNSFDISDLSPGMYVLQVAGHKPVKFVKE